MRAPALAFITALALLPAAALGQAGPPGGPPPGAQGVPPPGAQEAPPPPAGGGPPPAAQEAAPPSAPGAAPPPTAGGPPPKGAITRDQYIERAQQAAGRRFDEIDTNHLGYITRAQLRAFLAQRRHGPRPGKAEPPPQQE